MKLKQNKEEKSEIKNTNKTKIKVLSIFFAIFIVGVVGMLAMTSYFDKVTSFTLEENTYQYFGDGKSNYSSGTVIKNSKVINIVLDGKDTKGLDRTPIYSYENSIMYLPISYAYCSVNDNMFWRIPEFTKLEKDDATNTIHCSLKNHDYFINNGFLFDGGNNYIFFDDGKVIINDFEEYPVTAYSFFSKEYDIIRIYDFVNKDYRSLDTTSSNTIYISNSGYSIDLTKGLYIDSTAKRILLAASPDVLENIEESVSNG